MGSIIGKQGLKIKQIQDASGTRMIAGKEMLPQSTERIVELHGTTEGIRVAVWEIGKCLLEDWERGQGTVLYHPGAVGPEGAASTYPGGVLGSGSSYTSPMRKPSGGPRRNGSGSGSPTAERRNTNGNGAAASPTDPNMRTQNISIPADMVGCIIGKGGSKINEIRRLSGSKISIAKDAHDESMERMFTITGTAEANEKALFLLYNQLETEKERRMQSVQEQSE
ncbi:hypothetical protein BT69DRAFT_1277971 [Atractiella rhizophila]|nr:hypothetical protein BT69DRAFT_1277971 [Atractiella rhizophila]